MSHRPGRVSLISLVLALQAAVFCLPANGGASASTAPGAPDPPAPLASATSTPNGSWAVVAMGELQHPLDTFWELFSLAPHATSWRLVTPPAVADNGGLVVSVDGSGAVTVGFEPSQLLHYSPLALSDDEGATWRPALVPVSLAASPDALAVTSGIAGTALALVRGGSDPVLTSTGSLLGWHAVSGDRMLAGGSDARCGVTGLDAVGLEPSNVPLVGTGCRRSGQVGIFAHLGTQWQLIGPSLPGSSGRTTTRILRLDSSGATTTALVAAQGRGGTGLIGLWRSAAGTWTETLPLLLGTAATVMASAVGANGEQLVLVGKPGTGRRLEETAGPGHRWHRLPAPPAGTGTLALLADGSIDAFSVDGSHLSVFTLASQGDSWSLSQKMNVPLSYGSSS